jgi:hypothetical protein
MRPQEGTRHSSSPSLSAAHLEWRVLCGVAGDAAGTVRGEATSDTAGADAAPAEVCVHKREPRSPSAHRGRTWLLGAVSGHVHAEVLHLDMLHLLPLLGALGHRGSLTPARRTRVNTERGADMG